LAGRGCVHQWCCAGCAAAAVRRNQFSALCLPTTPKAL